MPNTPVLDQNIMSYLSGYADGEASFCVSFSVRSKLRRGIEVRPSFSVSQNGDRDEVLKLYRKIFNEGTIRPDRSDKTLKFEIRDLSVLSEKVIPHFKKYPLLSSKHSDFDIFAEICKRMKNKEHKRSNSLKKIIELAYMMNTGGKRKYSKEYLLNLVK